MLGEFTREEQSDRGLDFAGAQGPLLVVADQARGLEGDSFEDVVDERVHDGHASLGDSGFRMDLLENSVDVDAEGFGPLLLGDPLLLLLLSFLG